MTDRSSVIFGNKMPDKVYKKAVKSKKKYMKKFGDDSRKNYEVSVEKNRYIGDSLGVYNILVGNPAENAHYDVNAHAEKGTFDTEKGIIVGNIRMGFGHYRISMAMASAAKAMGYTPYWMDLNSYGETTCTKVIGAQNDLYSLGSRLSKNPIFNKLVWEPMNYEGFRALSYNAVDQKNAELMAPVYRNVPKDIPVIGTHVWPAQAAVHAGMKYVVNAIPDNWPMALHLSEGSVCSGDLADLKCKSCDIEAWSPRQQKYFEVCSCSNLGDAQARRLKIRYKDESGRMQLCHTLNNTCVAPPRMLIAFLENNLQPDGTVLIPKVLQPYMGGCEKLVPKR